MPDLAGKAVIFKVKVKEVKEHQAPVVDDEFAKDVSEFETLEEFKKSLGDKLLDSKTKSAQQEYENAVIEQLVGNSWAINTSKLALGDADLDKGMEEISLSAALTREQAAQMAFNAMKATLVEYEDKGGDIIIGDITINNGATKATPVTSKVKAESVSYTHLTLPTIA